MSDEIRILETADDVTDDVLAAVEECVDWFEDGPMPADEFLDRLCDSPHVMGWDVESLDNAAARKIMRHARQIRRERLS